LKESGIIESFGNLSIFYEEGTVPGYSSGKYGQRIQVASYVIEHGVLVTMLNYVRSYLDPLTVLATGITRNGTFLIENGKVTKALNNTRFLQSFVEALQNTTDIGSELMMVGEEFGSFTAPALKIEKFNFM